MFLVGLSISAQSDSNNPEQKPKVVTVAALQFWASYTFDEYVYDSDLKSYRKQNPLTNFQIRRSRIGSKVKVDKNLFIVLIGAFDLVGRNPLSGTEGGSNNGGSPHFRLWNAYAKYRISKGSEKLYIVAGYMVPQFGRESTTSAFRVNSFEKSWSQNYVRRHLVNTGPGRAVGMNVGGLFVKKNRFVNYSYQLGVFTPISSSIQLNFSETHQFPLSAIRFTLHLGDPEFTSYTITRKENYQGNRKGLSIGVNGASQYNTEVFDQNSAIGIDFLLNYNAFNLSGEWIYLTRNKQEESIELATEFQVGYVRFAYNIGLANGSVLMPSISYTYLLAPISSNSQKMAIDLESFAGTEHQIELGIHYHINSHIKLSAGITLRRANAGGLDQIADFNNYFFQNEVGKIKRGDWFGLGMQASL